MLKNWLRVVFVGVYCLSLHGAEKNNAASTLSASDVLSKVLRLSHAQKDSVSEQQVKMIIQTISRSIDELVMSSFRMPDVKIVNWDKKSSVDNFYRDLLNALDVSQHASLELVESLMSIKVVTDDADYVYRSWFATKLIPTIKSLLRSIKSDAIQKVANSSRFLDLENVNDTLSTLFSTYLSKDDFYDIEQQLSIKIKHLSTILEQKRLRAQKDNLYNAHKAQEMKTQEIRLKQVVLKQEQQRQKDLIKQQQEQQRVNEQKQEMVREQEAQRQTEESLHRSSWVRRVASSLNPSRFYSR